MKIKRRKVKRGRVEIIPLIDTIVILLIFYMSFSRVAQLAQEAVELPIADAGVDIEATPHMVIINMFSADDIRIGGDRFKMAELAEHLKQRKASDPTLSIMLRGRKDMDYQALSDLMGACAKAKIADVTFATYYEARR